MSMSPDLSQDSNGQASTQNPIVADARAEPPTAEEDGSEHLSVDNNFIGNIEPCRGNRGRETMAKFLFVFDLCLIWGSAGVAMLLTAHIRSAGSAMKGPLFPPGSAGFLLLFSVLIVLFAHVDGFYEVPWRKSLPFDLGLLAKSVFLAALITGGSNYLLHVRVAPTTLICSTIAASWIGLAAWRTFMRSQTIIGLTGVRKIVIVGCGPNGVLLRRHLEQNPNIGYDFRGYIDRRKGRLPNPARNKEEGDILGTAEELPNIVRTHFIDEVFISFPSDRHLVKEITRHAKIAGLNVRVVPDLYDGNARDQAIEYVGKFPTITLNQIADPTLALVVKRLFDIVFSASLLIILSPILLLIAVIIKLDSTGSVLFMADRIGRKGHRFRCYKLRTMVSDADREKEKLRSTNEREGPTFKIRNDPRITKVGYWLRKVSLDEIPQLWNVIRGDMSLVGPRPHPVDDCALYSIEHLRRLDVTPGMTGLWQVTARRDPSFETNIALDLEYIVNWNFWLDCRILLKTIRVVLAGTGQ
jgi:exopolysaccharide biosynthesis polyprenyl glycosylphosphotransferase